MSGADLKKARSILEGVIASRRNVLLETEGLELLKALGIPTPRTAFIERSALQKETFRQHGITSSKVVIKVISPEVLHKSDVGGVAIVANDPATIRNTIADMDSRLGSRSVQGYTLSECVEFEGGIRTEILLGIRFTADFGPIVTMGAGGIYTEFLAKAFQPGQELSVFSAELPPDPRGFAGSLERLSVGRLWTRSFRGKNPALESSALEPIIEKLCAFARECVPELVTEFEMNPIVASPRGPVALDVLVKLGTGTNPLDQTRERARARPLEKLRNLLLPRSAAIVGVSEKMNPGHIILNNLLREGFDPSRIYVIKPGSSSLEGCRCVPDIESLPERVDILVLAISAAQVPETIGEIIRHERAESVVIIPGGLEEKAGSSDVVARMNEAIERSRSTSWRGPVLNGGNCLGIQSVPGKYDTMFIPQYKIGQPKAAVDPAAFISQSGALAISRSNKLSSVRFRYSISVGNQTDLTIGDYLEFLKNDPEINVFAVYVEGFKPYDGLKFLKTAREITRSGRTVILYRSGRTAAGAKASASHTASIAGDYAVTRALCRDAGVIMAESLADFDDLVQLFTMLRKRKAQGTRLGAISNAGFECVAIGDSIGPFQLTEFSAETMGALTAALKAARVEGIVDVHNPLDLTPMAPDETYEKVTHAVLEDSNIDVAVVSVVPLTPALNSLAASAPGNTQGACATHKEDIEARDSIVNRLVRVWQSSSKPWVAVVDAGTLYDPMVQALQAAGIPTFRTVDRAMRLLGEVVSAGIGSR